MSNDMDKISEQVEWCLLHRPETRSCDLTLWLSVSNKFYNKDFKAMLARCLQGNNIDLPFELRSGLGDMKGLPSTESVRRTRQKIQNEKGKYLPDPSVVSNRRKREVEVKDWSISDRDTL